MKTQITLLTLIFFFQVNFSFANPKNEVMPNSIHVTYIGATGFLIESTNRKVLVEPTYNDIVKGFGYAYGTDSTMHKVLNGIAPFNDIDLILISHFHLGHFDVERTIQCLEANPGATLLTTADTRESIKNTAADFQNLSNQICVPEFALYEQIDTTIHDIDVSLGKSWHPSPSPATEMMQFYVSMDGVNLAFYLDYDQQENKPHHIPTHDIDLAIIDGKDFMTTSFREMLKADFSINYTLLTHTTNNSGMESQIENSKVDFPNVNFLRNSMEKFCFTFDEHDVSIDSLNLAPVVINQPANDTIYRSENFQISLLDVFEDPEGNEVKYTLEKSGGKPLPEWLNFNASTLTLTGTPVDNEKLTLLLTATDPHQSFKSTKFKLIVATPVGKNDLKKEELKVYPNPFHSHLHIETHSELDQKISIHNLFGQEVIQQKVIPRSENIISLSHIPNGLYNVSLISPTGQLNQWVVKK